MKKIFTGIILLLMCAPVFAQKKIKVQESSEKIGGGNNNALTVLIYEASVDEVEKEWKQRMKDYKAKVGNSGGEVFADDALIKDFGENTVDVYGRAVDNKDGSVTLIVGFNLGGAFLSSGAHPTQFKAAKDLLYNFAVNTTKNAIGGQLKEAEKLQKKMEKEQEDLVKSKEGLEKDIQSYKDKIAKAEEEIKENLKTQEAKKVEIETQKKVVETIGGKLKAVN